MKKIDFDTLTKAELLSFIKRRMRKQRRIGRNNSQKHRDRCKKLGVSSRKYTHLDSKALLDAQVRQGRV